MTDTPTLSELQQAKATIFQLKREIINLRAALADAQLQLAAADLSKEQQALSADFLGTLGGDAAAGDTWDWQTMSVRHPAPPPPPKE